MYETNLQKYMKEKYKNQFYALHPFSRDCEGIWDHNVWMWFTPEQYYEAQQDV